MKQTKEPTFRGLDIPHIHNKSIANFVIRYEVFYASMHKALYAIQRYKNHISHQKGEIVFYHIGHHIHLAIEDLPERHIIDRYQGHYFIVEKGDKDIPALLMVESEVIAMTQAITQEVVFINASDELILQAYP